MRVEVDYYKDLYVEKTTELFLELNRGMSQVENSCMGVYRIACQIREPSTPDRTRLDQGQIHSTRCPLMTETGTTETAACLLHTISSKPGNHGPS